MSMIRRLLFNSVALFALAVCTMSWAGAETNGVEFFEKSVRPLLCSVVYPATQPGTTRPAAFVSIAVNRCCKAAPAAPQLWQANLKKAC